MTIKKDIIYMAGLFDGEGYVGIHKRKNLKTNTTSYMLLIRIEMTYPKLLRWVQQTFGGFLHQVRPRPNCKETYVWGLNAEKALNFLNLISAYSKLKQKHIKIATRFQALIQPHIGIATSLANINRKHGYYEAIKKINRRGTTR
jgi:hypothetical protein